MKITVKQFATAAGVKREAAYGLISYLKEAGLAKEAGAVEKEPGAKGRAEGLYELELSSVAAHFELLKL
jgi:hypothetical protein